MAGYRLTSLTCKRGSMSGCSLVLAGSTGTQPVTRDANTLVTKALVYRAVARSENPGGLVVMGGENVPSLVEIGLTDLPKTGGGGLSPPSPPSPPPLRQPCMKKSQV